MLQAATYPWQQTIWQKVHTAHQRQQLPHALLFTGSTGCGHEQFIYALAQSLLCVQATQTGSTCGECRSCKVFLSHSHPDFMLVEPAEDKQTISVDQIRGLDHFLELSRSYSPNRVVLILNAEAMNTNAANSLLKSLEEPIDHSYILLFTAHVTSLLPTVRSRCQHLRLPLPTKNEALAWLQSENLAQTAAELLVLANGRPLAAISEDAGERLQKKTLFFNQLKSVLARQLSIAEFSAQWEKQDRQEQLDWQLTWVQSLIRQEVGEASSSDASELSAFVKVHNLWPLYEHLLELKALSAHPLNGRLFIENMLSLWQ